MPDQRVIKLTKDERDRLLLAKQYVLDHLSMKLSCIMLTKITGMNRKKIDAGFEETFGRKVVPFIQETRMNTALFLLKNTDKAIKVIAAEVGYRYTDNFTTAFKRYFGYSAKSVERNL